MTMATVKAASAAPPPPPRWPARMTMAQLAAQAALASAAPVAGQPPQDEQLRGHHGQEPDEGLLRPTGMKRLPCRPGKVWVGITVLALTVVNIAACSSLPPSPRSPIPPEFRAACGHPGARVTVRKVPVTISHADCNLTGVMISYPGYGGATVPHGSGGIGNSSGFTLTVHPGTLDVTVNATGTPGNA